MSRWSACGVALMLSVALSSTSCSSTRRVTESSSRAETKVEATAQRQETAQSEQEQERKKEETSTAVTVTEVEIYDTQATPDPVTGERPVKARIRQCTDSGGTTRETETIQTKKRAEVAETQTYNGGELSEAVVVAQKPPSLWERIKKGVMWGVAIIITAFAGYIIYKLKKR